MLFQHSPRVADPAVLQARIQALLRDLGRHVVREPQRHGLLRKDGKAALGWGGKPGGGQCNSYTIDRLRLENYTYDSARSHVNELRIRLSDIYCFIVQTRQFECLATRFCSPIVKMAAPYYGTET